MKHRALPIVLILLFCLLIGVFPAAARNVTLKLNSAVVQADVSPCIVNNRTLIPARALFEELGAKVSWDAANRKVTILYKNDSIVLTIDNRTAMVNGEKREMDVPATILQDRTMIPVRFVAENLGFKVEWDANAYVVSITTPNQTPSTVYSYFLTGAATQSYSDKTVVTVKGVGKASSSVMKLSNPSRLVFDFKDTKMDAVSSTITCDDSVLTSVRLGQFNPTTSRVVLDMKTEYSYSYVSSGNDFVITLSGSSLGTNTNTNPIVTPPTNGKRIVFIDPGHGGSEVGTVGKLVESPGHTGDLTDKIDSAATEKTIYEKDINLAISLKVDKLLRAQGIETCMLRTTDTYINIYDRPKIANEKDAYLYLSIHNNASTSTAVSGTQVYYSDSCPAFSKITNKELANIYYDAITEATGLRKAGVIDNPRYIVINQTNMPSLILEVAFVSNQSDLKKLLDSSFTNKVAQGICNATVKALEKTK